MVEERSLVSDLCCFDPVKHNSILIKQQESIQATLLEVRHSSELNILIELNRLWTLNWLSWE